MYANKKDIYLVIMISWLIGFLYLFYSKGEAWNYLIWHAGTIGIYPDTMQTILEAKALNPYNADTLALYPPLTYYFMYFFANLIPGDISWGSSVGQQGSTAFSYFFIFCIISILFIAWHYLNISLLRKLTISFAFISSAPFIYAFERGNLVIISCLFCIIFALYYDSHNLIFRELGLICLALAAAFKIYPAILGLILVFEKKYRESIRCIIYGTLTVFSPFLFLEENSLSKMLEHIKQYSDFVKADVSNWGYGFRIGITNWTYALCEYLSIGTDTADFIVLAVMLICICIFLCAALFYSNPQWVKVCALTLSIVMLPTFSWEYNIIYMIIPLAMYIKQQEEKDEVLSLKDIVISICFIMMFIPLPYKDVLTSLHGMQKYSLSSFVNSIGLIFMTIILLSITAINMFAKKH